MSDGPWTLLLAPGFAMRSRTASGVSLWLNFGSLFPVIEQSQFFLYEYAFYDPFRLFLIPSINYIFKML